MSGRRERVGRLFGGYVAGLFRTAGRACVIAVALSLMMALDLPRLSVLGIDLGATPAFAKNDRSSERSQGDRGRARGHDRRGARSDARDQADGRRIWNRPGNFDRSDNGRHLGHDRSDHSADRSERRIARAPSRPPLPQRRPVSAHSDDFRNHGDRVSTFVALAKELGFSAGVGAMQANFGTPFENGLVATDPQTGEFLKDSSGEFIIDATDAEIAAVKPGNGPRTGWETETDLDVNMDGVVDRTDLDLARDPDAMWTVDADADEDDD